jgi:hypothetical protein
MGKSATRSMLNLGGKNQIGVSNMQVTGNNDL